MTAINRLTGRLCHGTARILQAGDTVSADACTSDLAEALALAWQAADQADQYHIPHIYEVVEFEGQLTVTDAVLPDGIAVSAAMDISRPDAS